MDLLVGELVGAPVRVEQASPCYFQVVVHMPCKGNSTVRSKIQTKEEELYRYKLTNSMNKTLYTFH